MTPRTEALRDHACLIVHGPNRPGIVAAVSALLTRNQANIVSLDQYSDNPEGGAFFRRLVIDEYRRIMADRANDKFLTEFPDGQKGE